MVLEQDSVGINNPITHWRRHDSLDNLKIFIMIPIGQEDRAKIFVVVSVLRAMDN